MNMKISNVKYIFILMVLLISCQKEPIGLKVVKKLTINKDTHTFINDDGNPYFPNTMLSLQDKHRYELEMNKDVLYRISARQPDAFVNNIMLTLVNKAGDTMATSIQEEISQSYIVLKSPQTASYFLVVSQNKYINPSFNYRLYFEELVEEPLSFSGYDWYSIGEWKVTGSDTAEMKNHDSRFYRHLKLRNPVEGSQNVSFTVQSGTPENVCFGLAIEISDRPLQYSQYAYDLPDKGKAFIYSSYKSNYTKIEINYGSMSMGSYDYSNSNLNFSDGVKVELKFQSTDQFGVFLNGSYVTNINGSLNSFMILLQDRGSGISKITDFRLL